MLASSADRRDEIRAGQNVVVSSSGSQVTQVAVITNPDVRDKSALYNNILYPEVCIIDPELMLSVPKFVTACTGFDVFCHAFESLIQLKILTESCQFG